MPDHAAQNPSHLADHAASVSESSFETTAFDTFEVSASAPMTDPIEQLLATSDCTIAAGSTPDSSSSVEDAVVISES
jgi:hypothetical protein